ncbi:MAG: hypothetical protein WB116_05860 [Candidatus Dormiibacterota bacterium]
MTTDPEPQYRHTGTHRHKLAARSVAREHSHPHLHDLADKFVHDRAPYAHTHGHEEENQHDGKLVDIDNRPIAAVLAEAQRLRDEADKADSPSIARSYRDLARRLDPPEDSVLLAHDADYYRELAEQTAGESLSLSKGYRQMAERRELAGSRRSRQTVPFLAKSRR